MRKTRSPIGEIGRLARLERCDDLGRKLLDWIEGALDLFAGLLLEGGNHLGQRLFFLRIPGVVPPHHEVGCLRANRRHDDCRSKNDGSTAHESGLPDRMNGRVCA
jgi:hypothetical protein